MIFQRSSAPETGIPSRLEETQVNRLAAFLVEKRRIIFALFLALAAVSLPMATRVKINYDLAEYLPESSRMKQGMRVMEQEFGPAASSNLRVMFSGLSEEEQEEVNSFLSGMPQAAEIVREQDENGHTLFEITTECDSHAKEAAELFNAVHEKYRDAVTGGTIHEANVPLLPMYIIVAAVGLVFLVLLLMCNSWFEPVIFLVNIGIAVAINLGTNVVFSSVSEYTASIVGVMQLVLSMDYSIILLNRYTQEKEKGLDNQSAMKAAIVAAFPAVTGSSLTTFAGLVCLVFMSFQLGADMGFALAKSVIVSLVCIFTVLPSLILLSDPWIVKTRKKALHIPMAGYSRLVVRRGFIFPALFLALFFGVFLLKDNTEILYMLQTNNPIDEVFTPRYSLVLLYETKDGGKIAEALAPFEEDEKVTGITGYYNTLGKAYTPEEILELFGGASAMANERMVNLLFQLYAAQTGAASAAQDGIPLTDLIPFIQNSVLKNPLFAGFVNDEVKRQIAEAGDMIGEYAAKLQGEHYGRVILTTVYPEDSAETRAFIGSLSERCKALMEGETWLIGTSVMNEEMAQTFDAELRRITLLSAAAIFIVVAVTFRSLVIPLILVLTVQCGIYLTMTFIGLSGGGMYYLALLMVQCILMGATIDYGILYTSYYREGGQDREAAIRGAYDGALHTILTSALIVILAAGILGFMFANPAIGEICLTISRGAISATLLIVFILPGVLAALDRFVRKRMRN